MTLRAVVGIAALAALATVDRLEAAGFVPKHARREVFRAAFDAVREGRVYLPEGYVPAVVTPASGQDNAMARLAKAKANILQLVCAGRLNKQIAFELGIAETTVKAHVTAIMRKLGVQSRTQAVPMPCRPLRAGLVRRVPGWESEFAYLLVDGLSIREDELTSALASGLGPVPLFGGSAGDGTRFRRTFVLLGGQMHDNAAVLAMIRSDCRVKVFSLDHLQPTERRMVVTQADPARRIVRQINAEPSAQEYARILGKDPAQRTTFTFAAHPVVVRIGGKHHVRAIQRVGENGDLIFFSAIDEGLVLTLAEPMDMVAHLDRELSRLSDRGAPAAILACDCILRRMEAEEKQKTGAISALLRQHRVMGFSTYGEQLNGMHVNQTMTGVAIYPPEAP